MNVPAWVKPAVWGAVGGAIAAVAIGFFWGGWVTGQTAGEMASTRVENAIVLAFTPLCVSKAHQEPDKVMALKAESSWKRDDFVIAAGWVDNVSEKFKTEVARACATTVVEGMNAG